MLRRDPAIERALEQQRRERAEREGQEAEEAKQRRRENEELHRQRLAKLQAEKDERKRQREAELEESLAADKARERHRWLAEHPDQTREDFEHKAWPHLKANLLEQRKRHEMESLLEQARSIGRRLI